MSMQLYGAQAPKIQTLQDLYKQLTVGKDGSFEIDFPPESASNEDHASAREESRVFLLTLFAEGLKTVNARDGKSIMRSFYPTPGIASPFFDEQDLVGALNSANMLLDPRDDSFALAVKDGEVGAVRILGDVINMVSRYADARTAFVLLRMYARPTREGDQEKLLTETPWKTRREILIRRRNSMLAADFTADNNIRVPQLLSLMKNPEEQKLFIGTLNAFEQNAVRLKLTDLQRARWFFVLLTALRDWKGGELSAPIKEGLTALTLSFASAFKPDDVAGKIDAFVDSVAPVKNANTENGESAVGEKKQGAA